jgi:hypothetical protein
VEIYAQLFLDRGQTPLPEYVEPATSPVSRPDLALRYPLVLTSAKVVEFCHSQHRSLPRLRQHSRDPLVELHPAAAGPRGIGPDDWVVVETPSATMRGRARLNPSLAVEVVCALSLAKTTSGSLGGDQFPYNSRHAPLDWVIGSARGDGSQSPWMEDGGGTGERRWSWRADQWVGRGIMRLDGRIDGEDLRLRESARPCPPPAVRRP